MRIAYVDSSVLLAITLKERNSESVQTRLRRFDKAYSSNLLEAELRSVVAREGVDWSAKNIAGIDWIFPDRSLSDEIETVLAAGFVRGADCWHLANALYFAREPAKVSFFTLDSRQQRVARALGFMD